jgi:hypothetical protein
MRPLAAGRICRSILRGIGIIARDNTAIARWDRLNCD